MSQFSDLVMSGNYIILDTETTGLKLGSEIVSLAIIDSAAQVHYDLLIRPVRPIPSDATAIHGITNAMVEDAPTWAMLHNTLKTWLAGKNIIVYNAAFDRKMFHWQTLTNACTQMHVAQGMAHTALGDCLSTLALIKAMHNLT